MIPFASDREASFHDLSDVKAHRVGCRALIVCHAEPPGFSFKSGFGGMSPPHGRGFSYAVF